MSQEQYDYYAFISYKREDDKWARWLQRRLEGYRLPTAIQRDNPQLPKKIFPNFKDTTDIQPNPLEEEIRVNLRRAHYLVVICSPRSAKSHWVGFEINAFIEMGRGKDIILFIVEGEPYSGNEATECFHPILREKLPTMLGVNVHENMHGFSFVRKERALIQVISRMLNVRFDTLWQRQRCRMVQQLCINTGLALTFVGSCGYIWASNQAFDMTVHLHEISPHNARLPLVKGSYVEIQFGKEWVRKDFSSLSTPLVFLDIAAKYKGQQLPARLKSYGFTLTRPQIEASASTSISLTRDETYAKVKGWVRDDASNTKLAGVQVSIKGKQTTTDAEGRFELSLPLELQEEVYEITLTHEGKVHSFKDKTYPTKNDENFIIKYYLP